MPASAAVSSVRRMSGRPKTGWRSLDRLLPFWNLSPFPAARTTASRTSTDAPEFTTDLEPPTDNPLLRRRGRHFVGGRDLNRRCETRHSALRAHPPSSSEGGSRG